ncbi:MAG: hypothetical protein ACK5EA_02215 [Planctomycetaceae bacterium]
MESSLNGRIELAGTSPAGTVFRVSITCDNVRAHPDVPAPQEAISEVS